MDAVASFDDATWACYKAAVDAVRLSCPRGISDEFVLGHVGMLGALCAEGAPDVAVHRSARRVRLISLCTLTRDRSSATASRGSCRVLERRRLRNVGSIEHLP